MTITTVRNMFSQAALRHNKILNMLIASNTPLAIADIYHNPDIRALSTGMHSVADSIHNLRSRKLIRKVPAPPNSRAQIAYEYIKKEEATSEPMQEVKREPKITRVAPVIKPVQNMSPDINLIPEITITRTGVVVNTDKFKLTIEL
jgi:hypothetical protein